MSQKRKTTSDIPLDNFYGDNWMNLDSQNLKTCWGKLNSLETFDILLNLGFGFKTLI